MYMYEDNMAVLSLATANHVLLSVVSETVPTHRLPIELIGHLTNKIRGADCAGRPSEH
jgi:hypothetical protein